MRRRTPQQVTDLEIFGADAVKPLVERQPLQAIIHTNVDAILTKTGQPTQFAPGN